MSSKRNDSSSRHRSRSRRRSFAFDSLSNGQARLSQENWKSVSARLACLPRNIAITPDAIFETLKAAWVAAGSKDGELADLFDMRLSEIRKIFSWENDFERELMMSALLHAAKLSVTAFQEVCGGLSRFPFVVIEKSNNAELYSHLILIGDTCFVKVLRQTFKYTENLPAVVAVDANIPFYGWVASVDLVVVNLHAYKKRRNANKVYQVQDLFIGCILVTIGHETLRCILRRLADDLNFSTPSLKQHTRSKFVPLFQIFEQKLDEIVDFYRKTHHVNFPRESGRAIEQLSLGGVVDVLQILKFGDAADAELRNMVFGDPPGNVRVNWNFFLSPTEVDKLLEMPCHSDIHRRIPLM